VARSQLHQPVLLEEVLRLLNPQAGESYLDATAGYGGHAAAVLTQIGAEGRAVLVDRDSAATRQLERKFGERAEVRRANYVDAADDLVQDGSLFNMILLDLGVSSPQLDSAERGFSFKAVGPLDMRMDQSQSLTADVIVNSWPESNLADVIYRYGEDPAARQIAKAIVAARPVSNTVDLASVVERVARAGRMHAATRTFQALRMAVNDELAAIKQVLPKLERLLMPGGRLAVISFHSLEDRVVKDYFNRQSRDCICPPASPICNCSHRATLAKLTADAVAGDKFDANNPRARSAKLRAARKINQNKKEAKN
jgi:16S rRNA (cytosine1402-N4)-methyltransferase